MPALDATPKSEECRIAERYIASRFSERAQWEQSVHWGREALKVAPNDPAIMNSNLAWALAQMKDPSALRYGRKHGRRTQQRYWIRFGWIHLRETTRESRRTALRQSTWFRTQFSADQLHLAEALLRAGETKEARAHLADLVKLPEGSPVARLKL
ncbi:MAG: hypothetical protein KIS79_01465 [Burkholderiales bacterium]|nr:hypothetical protein [Burkholderiales bacterium]